MTLHDVIYNQINDANTVFHKEVDTVIFFKCFNLFVQPLAYIYYILCRLPMCAQLIGG